MHRPVRTVNERVGEFVGLGRRDLESRTGQLQSTAQRAECFTAVVAMTTVSMEWSGSDRVRRLRNGRGAGMTIVANLCRVLLVASWFVPTRAVAKSEVEIHFTGQVSNVFKDPFDAGMSVSPPTHVTGHILYDALSVASDPLVGCDCMGYRQHIPGGFQATFGGVTVRADDYVVQIKNDLGQPTGTIDTISVRYSNGFTPSLAAPLLVDGMPYPNSWFQVNFDGPTDTFVDASLPSAIDLHNFTSTFNFLDDDTSDGPIGVVFGNQSFTTSTMNAGDYDDDGNVNSIDFGRWRATYGLSAVLDADGNHDGLVDAADYVIWRDATTPQQAATVVVPEPATMYMVALLLVPCWRWPIRTGRGADANRRS